MAGSTAMDADRPHRPPADRQRRPAGGLPRRPARADVRRPRVGPRRAPRTTWPASTPGCAPSWSTARASGSASARRAGARRDRPPGVVRGGRRRAGRPARGDGPRRHLADLGRPATGHVLPAPHGPGDRRPPLGRRRRAIDPPSPSTASTSTSSCSSPASPPSGSPTPHGTIHLHATDIDGEWLVAPRTRRDHLRARPRQGRRGPPGHGGRPAAVVLEPRARSTTLRGVRRRGRCSTRGEPSVVVLGDRLAERAARAGRAGLRAPAIRPGTAPRTRRGAGRRRRRGAAGAPTPWRPPPRPPRGPRRAPRGPSRWRGRGRGSPRRRPRRRSGA